MDLWFLAKNCDNTGSAHSHTSLKLLPLDWNDYQFFSISPLSIPLLTTSLRSLGVYTLCKIEK